MREIHHPLDVADAATIAAMRAAMAAHPMEPSREAYDWLLEQTPDAEGVSYEAGSVGGVRGVRARPAVAKPRAAILYVHGGAYVLGSAQAYRHFAGQVAARAGIPAFVPDYRLAPEHPFPAAVVDARAALAGLRSLEGGLEALAIVGDSAGGGLGLAILAEASRAAKSASGDDPRMAGALFSPWTDLALTGESLVGRAAEDPLLKVAVLDGGSAQYLAGHDARDPLASPLYADFARLPPVQVHVGTAEILLDDARRLSASDAFEVHVWEGVVHVFPNNVATLKAAREALDLTGAFLARTLFEGA
jgi:monoterpene epsilon-lactone hydrolase